MKKIISYSQQNQFRVVIENTFPALLRSKKEDDKATFNQLLLEITPNVKTYITERLNTAIKKGHFPKGKYKADGFVSQLFIEVYDHIETFKDEKDFYVWLFKKTNELLEETIQEEEFDDLFLKNIDTYSKPEWDAMEEKFSTDGGGDLVMIEELDDSSYNHHDYTLNHVFVEDDKNDLIEKIDKNLNNEAINRHVKTVLHNLPLAMRSIFELSTKQHLDLEEIAQIRNSDVSTIEKLLKDARSALQISLFNRYSEL